MIAANVEGTRVELSRLERLARTLRMRLERFQQADRVQDSVGESLSGPQKQAHLTAFEADRIGMVSKFADVQAIIDSPTVIDVDVP